MRTLFLILSALSMMFNGYGYSMENGESVNKSSYSSGYRRYGKESLDSIEANGPVTLEGTKVLGLVLVNGSLNAEGSTIGSLKVNGAVDLKNCLIHNLAKINGSLHAENSKFEKELFIASKKITLKACSVDSLIVCKSDGQDGAQVIELTNETTISGPIVVESGNGEIWLSSDSKISESLVKGAKVIRR